MDLSILHPLRIVYPARCVLCGNLLPIIGAPGFPACSSCVQKLPYIEGIRCKKCGRSLISEREYCMNCRKADHVFMSNTSVMEYIGTAKELIYQYKFKGNKQLAVFFATLVYCAYITVYNDHVCVPVPSSLKKRKRRGWDPVYAISKTLKNVYGLPVVSLLKKEDTVDQKKLSYTQRQNNLKNKIHVKKGSINIPRKVVLIDDVYTTGSTISECAAVLYMIGVQYVNSITVAQD
jgi:ComF family protein